MEPAKFIRTNIGVTVAAALLAACSPGNDGVADPDASLANGNQPETAPTSTSACDSLIELQSSELQLSELATQNEADPAPHCKLSGVIDSAISFELLLPDSWNGKFFMGGGGGFVGSVQNQAQGGMSGGLTPLERGYATVGTDTGHTASGIDASWALNNQEAKENFAHRAVHRTTVVSKQIISEYYEGDLEYSYFLGCSRGGGQAMIAAQRYPQDFDGIVAAAPALDWAGIPAGFIRNQQFVYPDPNDLETPVITQANRELLAAALLESCDAIDGVIDGILNDPRNCGFDPADLRRCDGDPAAGCVTGEQLTAIEAIYAGPNIDGEQLHPGFPFGGETDSGGWDEWITRAENSTLPTGIPNLHFGFGMGLAKNFIFSDPDWSYAGYEYQNWYEDSAETAALLNSTDPDLAVFRDRGGKLILWHGWSDSALTTFDTIEYYDAVEERDPALRDFFRMFLMPGVGHCFGGPGPDTVDWITAIEQWVENDQSPEQLLASKYDDDGNLLMERPLCTYPQIAHYDDTGDPDIAKSFACALPDD